MLPGQEKASSRSIASSEIWQGLCPACAYFWASRSPAGDVFGPLAERRQVDLDHVQSIVEILPELTFLDHRLEAAIGRRDDANIDSIG